MRLLRKDMGEMADISDADESAFVGAHGQVLLQIAAEMEYHALLPQLQLQSETGR